MREDVERTIPKKGRREVPLTEKAKAFLEANRHSPVVYGSATHVPGEPECPENCTGLRLTLHNGRTFTLRSRDLQGVKPRWRP
jgi:hypothetical protein